MFHAEFNANIKSHRHKEMWVDPNGNLAAAKFYMHIGKELLIIAQKKYLLISTVTDVYVLFCVLCKNK